MLAIALAACGTGDPNEVVADRYDSFWLWAGVPANDAVRKADTVYILDGELRGEPARFVPLRPGVPKAPNPHIWLVVRTDTLDWPVGTDAALVRRLDRWAAAGNKVDGIQIDFDAATRGLSDYAAFLTAFRKALPSHYKLSITGLMDWSANGDPDALRALAGTVDEVVIQTYQGRSTILGYDAYFDRMKGYPIPFKVGLVEHGRFTPPASLESRPNFKGYVVFLIAPK